MYTIFEKRERKMFVVCPKCAAKYQIPLEITLKEGQKVQCSACQNVFNFQGKQETIQNESSDFHVLTPDDPVLVPEKTVVQEEISIHELPEVFQPLEPISKEKSYTWMWIILCLVFFFLLVAGIWLYRDILKMDYTSSSYPKFSLPRVNKKIVKSISKSPNLADNIEIPLFESELPESSQLANVQSDAFRFHSIRFRSDGTDLLIEGIIHNDTNVPQMMPESVQATAYDQRGNILFQKEIFLSNEVIQPYGQKAFFGSYSPAPDGVQWVEVSCKK